MSPALELHTEVYELMRTVLERTLDPTQVSQIFNARDDYDHHKDGHCKMFRDMAKKYLGREVSIQDATKSQLIALKTALRGAMEGAA